MYFSKILPVTLFAALAVAAPAPQGVSVTTEQIQQFSDSVQSFASNTDSSFSELNAQKDALAGAWGGEGSQALAQAFEQFAKSVNEIVSTASELSSALDSSSESFQDAEESNADWFG